MNQQKAQVAIAAADLALANGEGLSGTGYWPLVRAAKRDPSIAGEFGDEIARLDRKAFEQRVKLRLPAGFGVALLSLGTAAGVALIALAAFVHAGFTRDVVFLAGFGALDVFTHSLAHWIVGTMVGIRFTHIFLGGPPPPRPGFKTDYASYLKTSARARAVMHASGAVVTKLVPFASLPLAVRADTSPWVIWVLIVVGVGQIITDLTLSTKTSDWMKVRRELGVRKT